MVVYLFSCECWTPLFPLGYKLILGYDVPYHHFPLKCLFKLLHFTNSLFLCYCHNIYLVCMNWKYPFQFSLFFLRWINLLALYLFCCHCQCLLSCTVWYRLQSQRRNANALLPPVSLLSTQFPTSPVPPHLSICSLQRLMVALCVSCCCLHIWLKQRREFMKAGQQDGKVGIRKSWAYCSVQGKTVICSVFLPLHLVWSFCLI